MLQAAGPRTQPWQEQTVSQLPAGLSTPREGRQRTGRNKLRQEFLLDSRQYLNFLFCHGSGTLLGGRQPACPAVGGKHLTDLLSHHLRGVELCHLGCSSHFLNGSSELCS